MQQDFRATIFDRQAVNLPAGQEEFAAARNRDIVGDPAGIEHQGDAVPHDIAIDAGPVEQAHRATALDLQAGRGCVAAEIDDPTVGDGRVDRRCTGVNLLGPIPDGDAAGTASGFDELKAASDHDGTDRGALR